MNDGVAHLRRLLPNVEGQKLLASDKLVGEGWVLARHKLAGEGGGACG